MAFYLNSSTHVFHKYFIGKLSLTALRESMIRAIGKTSLKACEQKEIDIFYLLTVAFCSYNNPDVVCWVIGNMRPRTENNLCKLFRSLPFRGCRIAFHPKHRVPPHALLRQLLSKISHFSSKRSCLHISPCVYFFKFTIEAAELIFWLQQTNDFGTPDEPS